MKTIDFTSAQNVKVEYEIAPVVLRLAAAIIDGIILAIYFIVVFSASGWIFSGISGKSLFFILLVIKLPVIFYNPALEYLMQGQTLGKYLLGIRVVTMNGERPGLREVFTRWMFKGDFIWISINQGALWLPFDPSAFVLYPIFGIVGMIFALTSYHNQRLGDVMAGTIIIRNKSSVRYFLRDILMIKNQDNHVPTYPQAIRFTDDDMLLIKAAIARVHQHPNEETKKFAVELANETARLLGLSETPPKKLDFLKTVLQDYVVLTR